MNAFWNLVWIVPLAILIGLGLSAYWPLGKGGAEGPPYVGFDDDKERG